MREEAALAFLPPVTQPGLNRLFPLAELPAPLRPAQPAVTHCTPLALPISMALKLCVEPELICPI